MTTASRPPQISDLHLRRKAVVYIRQSSEEQVRYSVGSTALQRDLPAVLEGWGWLPEAIEVIDVDLGVSGSHAGLRQGFSALVQRVASGEIGVVAVIDISRLARNLPDLFQFADTARRQNVLLFHGGQVTDFNDPNAEFVGLILGLNAARENRARAEHARGARRKKAEAGIATTAAPAGYLAERGGSWRKDPDLRVREVIQLVFDKFMELGSCGAVVRYLLKHGLQLPRRRERGTVKWGAPLRVRVHRILRNPAYCGMYVYGVTQSKDGRLEKVPRGDWHVAENHHEPYVPHDQWEEIQRRLHANRRSIRAPLGRGDAVLQGLLRCTLHDRRFGTFYPFRERRDGTVLRRGVYRCFAQDVIKDPFCSAVRASTLDLAVERILFRVLDLPALDVIREVHRESEREYRALIRLREAKERQAEQEATEAERAYQQADTAHHLVKQRLGQRWEAALQRLQDCRTEHKLHPLTPPRPLGDDEQVELRRLVADLPTVWLHPSVTPAQRKAVVRAVINMIHVTPRPDSWEIDIEWVGGNRTKFDFLTSRGVHALVSKAAQAGCSAGEIAQILADRGAIQRSGPHIGKPYTAQSVKLLIRKAGWERVFKRQAYAHIRTRYLDGCRLRDIARELNERGLHHPRGGPWTEHRVQGAVYRLRINTVAEIPQLPAVGRFEDRVVTLHDQGRSPAEIARQLRHEGILTTQRRPATPDTVRQLLRRRARSFAAHEAEGPRTRGATARPGGRTEPSRRELDHTGGVPQRQPSISDESDG
jgi:DNA invertase Pin-like site-specific DNA recombinase